MSLKLKLDGSMWRVFADDKAVAEIYLDFLHQVYEVVLYASAPSDVQLEVLHLAASHALQFAKDRWITLPSCSNIEVSDSRRLTEKDSLRLMNYALVPDTVKKLDRNTIVKAFRSLGLAVSVAMYGTPEEAINVAFGKVGVKGLKYEVIQSGRMLYQNEVYVQFAVPEPYQFTFWHHQSASDLDHFGLYIVPSYHPVKNKWKPVCMVNGATDYNIRGLAVRAIYSPEASRSVQDKHPPSSWTYMNHPFYASGCTMSMALVATKVRSAEGVKELSDILRAALQFDSSYIEVCGGFHAPLAHPRNLLHELGHTARRDFKEPRGSEAHCVWSYRTLEKEGVLDKAHIPSWFISEGWLDIYKGAEVGAMLY